MSESINKKVLTDLVSEKLSLTKKQSAEIIDVVLEEIAGALKSGKKVDLAGFGSFTVKERSARTGFNPLTKESIQIEASRGVGFKPAKALKDLVK